MRNDGETLLDARESHNFASELWKDALQSWANEWSLGCMNPASLLPLATGSEFTQPRAHLLADPCTVLFAHLSPEIRISTLGLFVHTLRHTELCTGL